MPEERIFNILVRKAEIEMAERPGRPRDQHKQMQQVAQIFGTTLEDFKAPFQVASRSGGVTLGPDLQQALAFQKETAERIRQQQDQTPTQPREAPEEAEEDLHCDAVAQVLLQSIPEDLVPQGPVPVARNLVDAASLNDDQTKTSCTHRSQHAERMGEAREENPHEGG